ncbi:hypothetical protein KO116_04137 [Halomonas sp. KO116]|nr:hypothetical protein KO116_04137 [Halomonas sp. KO116]
MMCLVLVWLKTQTSLILLSNPRLCGERSSTLDRTG